MALDFAVTSGLRQSNLVPSLLDGGHAARSYEDFKNSHLDTKATCHAEGFGFTPMVVEAVGGGWGASAQKVFYELAKRKASLTGELKNNALKQLHQNLGIILHRENARSILRRSIVITTSLAAQVIDSVSLLQGNEAEAHV